MENKGFYNYKVPTIGILGMSPNIFNARAYKRFLHREALEKT